MSAPSTTASSPSPAVPSTPNLTPAPALTTPYVFPPECTHSYNVTSRNTTYQSYAQLSETFLYVQTDEAHYQSCQPPGRSSMGGHRGEAYSAAVCPEGWMAWNVGLASRFVSYSGEGKDRRDVSSTWSTAQCCQSGHTLASDIWTLYTNLTTPSPIPLICIAPISSTSFPISTLPISRSSFPYFELENLLTTPSGFGLVTSTSTLTLSTYTDISSTILFTQGRAFYPAWSVDWDETDNPMLSPRWPALTSDILIPTWMPGDTVPAGIYENKGAGIVLSPRQKQEKWVLPTVITLGVLLGLSLGALLFALWRLRRERRRRTQAEEVGNKDHTPVNGTAARRVSMRESGGARVVQVRRSGRRSNGPL